jgi:hypothetical protein
MTQKSQDAVNDSRFPGGRNPIDRSVLAAKADFLMLKVKLDLQGQRLRNSPEPDIQALLDQVLTFQHALRHEPWGCVIVAAQMLIATVIRLATEGNPILLSFRTGQRLNGPNTTYTGSRA